MNKSYVHHGNQLNSSRCKSQESQTYELKPRTCSQVMVRGSSVTAGDMYAAWTRPALSYQRQRFRAQLCSAGYGF